jgi:Bacterial Ig domain
MIKITKILNVTGDGPFQYQWNTTNSCASFSKASSTTTGVIQTDILFADEACVADADISITVIPACGVPVTQPVVITNPCEDLTINGPSVTGDFTFSANIAGSSCTTATFNWVYDTSLFTQVSLSNSAGVSTIKLALKRNNPPTTTAIQVNVVDCANCQRSATLNYLFCVPTLPAKTIYLYSDAIDENYVSGETQLSVNSGCSTFTPDWSTVSFSQPSLFSISFDNFGKIQINANSSVVAGTYSGTYSVKSTLGVSSQQGNLTFILSRPVLSSGIVLQDSVFTLTCDQVPGTVVDVPIDYYVSGSSTVDWSTFQIVTPPVPKSTSVVLGFDTNGARVIKYTVPNPIESDAFSFILCDTNGNCADAGSISIIECAPDPVATNDAFSVVCGSTTDLAILLNDDGNGSPLVGSSVVITQAPANGTVSMNNGVATYIANSNYSGTDTFKYTVKNGKGATSNEATATITITCAGSDVAVTICN